MAGKGPRLGGLRKSGIELLPFVQSPLRSSRTPQKRESGLGVLGWPFSAYFFEYPIYADRVGKKGR